MTSALYYGFDSPREDHFFVHTFAFLINTLTYKKFSGTVNYCLVFSVMKGLIRCKAMKNPPFLGYLKSLATVFVIISVKFTILKYKMLHFSIVFI